MECTIDWMPANGMAFCAETGSGHLLTMDGAPDGGGRNLAPRPMETVLAGTGACTAYDVVLILQSRPPRRARLPRQGDAGAARRRIRRCSPRSSCTSSSAGVQLAAQRGRARDRAFARQLLLGDDHARQDGGDRRPATRSSRRARTRRSDVVRRRRHHLGRQRASPSAHGAGQAARRRRCSAAIAWPASSSLHLRDDRARRQVGPAGSRSRWLCQMPLHLALGLDHEAEAGRIAQAAGDRPMPKAPAYQSGLSRLWRAPSSRSRSAVQARWSVSSPAARSKLARAARVGAWPAPARCRAPGRRPRRRG